MPTSDHRPVALSLSIHLTAIGIDPKWREKRDAARRMELVAGLIAYLGLTWEGNGILLAIAIGAVGGWAVIRGVLNG